MIPFWISFAKLDKIITQFNLMHLKSGRFFDVEKCKALIISRFYYSDINQRVDKI